MSFSQKSLFKFFDRIMKRKLHNVANNSVSYIKNVFFFLEFYGSESEKIKPEYFCLPPRTQSLRRQFTTELKSVTSVN